jgi:sensor histidine kinase YesM
MILLTRLNWKIVALHCILWSALLLIPVYIHLVPSSILAKDFKLQFIYWLVSGCTILYFYLHYLLLIPWCFNRGRKRLYFILLILFIGSFAGLEILLGEWSGVRMGVHDDPGFNVLRVLFLRFMAAMAISWLVYLVQLNKRKEFERQKSELNMLRSRVHPHFLYNTLNSLYSMALRNSEGTAESIAKLSDIMRYYTEGGDKERVLLQQEVDYLREYIELQELRLTEKTQLALTLEGEFRGRYIPPLLLINFVENAFKYGVSNEKPNTISVKIVAAQDALCFEVINSLKVDRPRDKEESTGIRDVKERLDLMYGRTYQLYFGNYQDGFRVQLKIPYL